MRYTGIELNQTFQVQRFWASPSSIFRAGLDKLNFVGDIEDGIKVYAGSSDLYPKSEKLFPYLLLPEHHPLFNCAIIFIAQPKLTLPKEIRQKILRGAQKYIKGLDLKRLDFS